MSLFSKGKKSAPGTVRTHAAVAERPADPGSESWTTSLVRDEWEKQLEPATRPQWAGRTA